MQKHKNIKRGMEQKWKGKDGIEGKKRQMLGMRKGTKRNRWREYEEPYGKITIFEMKS